ncbi:Creatinase/aminopeptidase [Thozetella sp. PMI_491]|nr:Creatinase/aminopeptidase [Thozetella sp. PMI_491]
MKLSPTALQQFRRHIRPRYDFALARSQTATGSFLPTRTSRNATSWSSWWSGRAYTSVSAASLQFGQPVHETHPHILKAGEITPGISAQEYANRRAALAHALSENSIVILPAAELLYKSGSVFHAFRQESNLLYLTGFLEPKSVAVIQKTGPNFDDYIFHLFCRPKDPKSEQWSGPWSGVQAARDVFNADQAYDIATLDTVLPGLLQGASRIYADVKLTYPEGHRTAWAERFRAANKLQSVSPLQPVINQLRAIKSPAEIANMRKAGRASGRAITDAMRRAWAGEKELEKFLDYQFTVHGCDGPAYVPVVAGGERGCMIHYVHNTATLKDGEMVLVDAGGEYGGYVTDITRTWPIGGKFSPAQKDLYEAVLKVQRASVSLCRESAGLTLDQIHRSTETGLTDQLRQLGFDMSGNALDVLFPHHVGHYVGVDLHDIPGYARHILLKAGHCVTVEPGIYVPDDDRFPKHFRGLAVRIEDSVCVDEDSPLILTTEAVKEVVDIEALRG